MRGSPFNRTFYPFLALLLLFWSETQGQDTCSVSISASTTVVPCSGDSVTLDADAIGGTQLLIETFNDSSLGSGWTSNQDVNFSNPCDPSPDGSPYAWMGPNATQPRELTTVAYDVSCGGEICFDMDFAEQGTNGNSANECEGPDLPDEGVHFQYSTNNGTSWTDIQYFDPDTACCGCGGGCEGENPSPFVDWDTYCFHIPPAAQGPNTKFRWYQIAGSGSCCDHWGVDDVKIVGSGCDFDYDWQHVTGVPNDSHQTVYVESDTTYTACYTNMHNGGSDSCCTDIKINTEGIDSLSFDTITESCILDDDGEITVNTHGGTGPYFYKLSGPVNDSDSTATFTGLPDGDYYVEVVEDGGCTASDSVTLLPGDTCCDLEVDSLSTQMVGCYGASDGLATVYDTGGYAPVEYVWFDGSGNPIGQRTQTASGLSAGTYIVGLKDKYNCTASDTVTITQPPGPWYVETSSDSSHCGKADGNAYVDSVFGNVGPYSYQWSASANGQTGPGATGIPPGSHDVTISDSRRCDTTVTIEVGNIEGHTTSMASRTDVSCFGGSDGEATAQVTGGTSPYSYRWNDPSGQTSKTATGLSTGTYKVLVTDANGCEDSATVTIDEPSPLKVSSNSDTTICQGGVATISANASGGTPPYTYHWDSGLGTGRVKNVNPGSDSFYSVYVEDANGCTSSSVTVKVQYHPPLSVDALSDDSICPGGTSSLAAIGSGGSGKGYTYTWSNGDNGKNTDVSPSTNTTYTVRLEDHCETPAAEDSVRIGLYQVPEVEVGGRDLEDCAPVEATLINETPEGMVGGECIWDLGDGVERPGCDSVHKKYTEPGCYDIDLTVRSPEGCVDSSSVNEFVCVRPYPEALFDYEPEETTVQDPVFKFRNLSTGSRHHEWSFGGLDSSSQEHPRYSFPADSAGEYRVCMEASSRYGCKDTTCSVVSLGGEVIVYVPNAFTPDGDGVNDRFGPVVQGVDESDYHFYIYDRWGEVVFESHHPEKRWDGSVKGSEADSKTDVYVWRLVTKNKYTGEEVEKEGHVTLIR